MLFERKAPGRSSVRPDAETLAQLYRNHTAKEIAIQYGVKEATVRSWIARCRREGDDGGVQQSDNG